MRILSVTEVARNFREVIDSVESNQEEVVSLSAIRSRWPGWFLRPLPKMHWRFLVIFIARLMKKPPMPLHPPLAKARKSRRGRLSELRNPWVG